MTNIENDAGLLAWKDQCVNLLGTYLSTIDGLREREGHSLPMRILTSPLSILTASVIKSRIDQLNRGEEFSPEDHSEMTIAQNHITMVIALAAEEHGRGCPQHE